MGSRRRNSADDAGYLWIDLCRRPLHRSGHVDACRPELDSSADTFEAQLIDRLVRERRRFIKILSGPHFTETGEPSVALTDVGEAPALLYIEGDPSVAADDCQSNSQLSRDRWTWYVHSEAMPSLPNRRDI